MGILINKNKIGIGTQLGALLNYLYVAFKNRVLADGGEIDSQSDLSSYITMAKANGIYDSIQFGMLGAYNIRTSGNTKYVTKAYSMDATPRDATQTTEVAQPYLSGFIAPNEKWGLKNPNGGVRYMTHPTISFAANEAWSVTSVIGNNGKNLDVTLYCGEQGTANGLYVDYNVIDARLRYYNGTSYSLGSTDYSAIGKNTIYTFVHSGTIITTYINGLFYASTGATSNITFDTFIAPHLGRALLGSISSHIIRNQALTPTQVQAEATKLRQIFPEIPSVQIGTQRWATSNCEMVATPQGNVIPEVTDNATWAALLTEAWSYHSNDASLGALYGKIYNGYARDLFVTDIAAFGTWGHHVSTEAELTALALNGGYALKYGGIDYWDTDNGTNATGFTALGGGTRSDVDGTFSTIKDSTAFWCADSDKVLLLNHADNTATIVAADKSFGAYIRLVKD